MIDIWEQTRTELKDRIDGVREKCERELVALEHGLEEMIDKAKNNEILSEIKKLNVRLDEFEKRLPPIEEEK